MGAPIKIIDLASILIATYGKKQTPKNIKITGLRSGEKLHESLIHENEELISTENRDIFIVRSNCNKQTASIDFSKLKSIAPFCSNDMIKVALKPFL